MTLKDLALKNRSYRRFYQSEPVPLDILRELTNLARLSASAANMQPLKYVLSHTPEKNAAIFPALAWAGYLADWSGPADGERPSAYIVILGDNAVRENFGCDHGIAAQSILLGAVEKGFGGCMIGAIDHAKLRGALGLPQQYEILLVIALGRPKEQVVIEPVGQDGSVRYWRDAQHVHHVPKRALDDVILPL